MKSKPRKRGDMDGVFLTMVIWLSSNPSLPVCPSLPVPVCASSAKLSCCDLPAWVGKPQPFA